MAREKKDKPRRFAQFREAYQLTKRYNRTIGLEVGLVALIGLGLGVGIGFAVGHPVYFFFISLPFALLFATIYFSRRAEKAAYSSIEGQPGAAASVVMAIRRGWTVTPAVAVNKNQDMVHRAVGRPGVVLIAEGGFGATTLLKDEKRKSERYVPGTPITTITVGNAEGQTSLRSLQKQMRKLPKQLSNAQVREVRNRLKAVGGMSLPIPKGPMPKNLRMPRPR